MTVLALLRHAKAVKHERGGDHARALDAAGRGAAATAGARLLALLPPSFLVVASDARRARETAELAFPHGSEVRLEPALYDASAAAILGVVRALPATAGAAVLVGHNPGLSELADLLSGRGEPGDLARVAEGLATADSVVIEFDGGWAAVGPKRGRVLAMLARQEAED